MSLRLYIHRHFDLLPCVVNYWTRRVVINGYPMERSASVHWLWFSVMVTY